MIQCLRGAFAAVLQEDMTELFSQNQTKTNTSPRQKKVLISQVKRKDPIVQHTRFEEEMSLEEITNGRSDVWHLAATLTPSYSGCFHFGVRTDVGTLGSYEPVNMFYAEQKALQEGRRPKTITDEVSPRKII